MSKLNDLFTKIRLGFADARFFMSNIPNIVKGIKSSAKKEMLKAHFHNICDKAVEAYGDVAIAYAEKIDLNAIQSLTEDVMLLIAKHQEPIQKTLVATAEAITEAMDKYNGSCEEDATAITKILKDIAKENKWDKLKVPSTVAHEAEVKAETLAQEKKLHEKQQTNKKRHAFVKLELARLVSSSTYALRAESVHTTYEKWLDEEASKFVEAAE